MTDLNKEREAFEQHLIDTGLVEFAGYGFDVDECDEYIHEPTNVAWGTWVIGLNRAKAQAVPEQIADDIQSWIAVESIQAMELDGETFVVGANELAEFITQLVYRESESGAEG